MIPCRPSRRLRSLAQARPQPSPRGTVGVPNSAIEWFFLRRHRWHMGGRSCLLNGEGLSLSRSAGKARRNARFAFRVLRVPLAEPVGTLDSPFGSFAFPWRSQTERSVCPSGPSPLQGLGPRSLTPPLAHSSPRSSPESNAPHPLAGDRVGMPVMKIHRDLHCHFAFHSGIGRGALLPQRRRLSHSTRSEDPLTISRGSFTRNGWRGRKAGLPPGRCTECGVEKRLAPAQVAGGRRGNFCST